jgi:5-enolpyruvylshikimate-3-phosphate synthase
MKWLRKRSRFPFFRFEVVHLGGNVTGFALLKGNSGTIYRFELSLHAMNGITALSGDEI